MMDDGQPPSVHDSDFDEQDMGADAWEEEPVPEGPTAEEILQEKLRDLESFAFERPPDPEEDPTGKLAYRATCEKLDQNAFFRFPIDSVVDKLDKADVDLTHCSLGDRGAQALSETIRINAEIQTLTLTDNWITPLGAAAIFNSLLTNKSVRAVDFSQNRLGALAMIPAGGVSTGQLIFQLLKKNTTLQEIVLRSNKIGDRDMEMIAEGVIENTTLTALDVSYNELGPRGGDAIAMMLRQGTDLRELNLEWNQLRNQGSLAVLRDGFMHTGTVRKFNIAWNGVGDEGGEIIGDVIRGSSVLEELDVSHNRIGLKGAMAIALGVEENTTLVRLTLNDNPLQDAGCAAVIRALRDNKTIQRVDLRATDSGKLAAEEVGATRAAKRNNRQFSIEMSKTLFQPMEW